MFHYCQGINFIFHFTHIFKDVLTIEQTSDNVLHWGRAFAFVSTGNEKLWIPSKLIEIRFGHGKPDEEVGYRGKGKKAKKNYRTGDM